MKPKRCVIFSDFVSVTYDDNSVDNRIYGGTLHRCLYDIMKDNFKCDVRLGIDCSQNSTEYAVKENIVKQVRKLCQKKAGVFNECEDMTLTKGGALYVDSWGHNDSARRGQW